MEEPKRVSFPIANNVAPKLLSDELVGVQPAGPSKNSHFHLEVKDGPPEKEEFLGVGHQWGSGFYIVDESGKHVFMDDEDWVRLSKLIQQKKNDNNK